MKNTVFIVAASVAVANAQFHLENGTYTCDTPLASYCSSDSLKTDIIIRCDAAKVGHPGRCGDNLVGEPPVGNFPALCFQSSSTSGDAACEKNCVVYANAGPSTLPASLCTPTFTASSSPASSSASYSASTPTSSTAVAPTTTASYSGPGSSSSSSSAASSSVSYPSSSSSSSSFPGLTTTITGGNPAPTTTTTSSSLPPGGNGTLSTSPTPSKSGPSSLSTAAAAANQVVGGVLAAALGLAAYLL